MNANRLRDTREEAVCSMCLRRPSAYGTIDKRLACVIGCVPFGCVIGSEGVIIVITPPSDGRMDGERVNSRGSLRSIFPFQAQSPSTETPFGSNLRCAAMTAAYVSAMIGMRNGERPPSHHSKEGLRLRLRVSRIKWQ